MIVSPSQFSEGFCEILAAEVASRIVLHLFLPDVIGSSGAQELRTGKDIFSYHFSDVEDTVFYSLFHWFGYVLEILVLCKSFCSSYLFQGKSKVNSVPVWVLKPKVICEGLFPGLNASTLVSVSGNWECLLIFCKLDYEFKDVFCLIQHFWVFTALF